MLLQFACIDRAGTWGACMQGLGRVADFSSLAVHAAMQEAGARHNVDGMVVNVTFLYYLPPFLFTYHRIFTVAILTIRFFLQKIFKYIKFSHI